MKPKKQYTKEDFKKIADFIGGKIEADTGLHAFYMKDKEVLVIMPPKTDIVLGHFFFFLENGEIILDSGRLTTIPWLLELVESGYKSYKKANK
jgi:hypothetical protein